MSDHLSPISTTRFVGLNSESSSDSALSPPSMADAKNPEEWLRLYVQFYLSKIDPSVGLRKLFEAAAGSPPLALFGEMPVPTREYGICKGFTDGWARFSEADQRTMEAVFPRVALSLLETAVKNSIDRVRIEGKTAAADQHELELQGLEKGRQSLEKEVRELRSRLRVMNSRVLRGFLFMVLLVGSLSLALWFAQVLGPQATQVTIEYNIGEIIAAILGGTGAAAAGLGYAAKSLRKPGDDEKAEG